MLTGLENRVAKKSRLQVARMSAIWSICREHKHVHMEQGWERFYHP